MQIFKRVMYSRSNYAVGCLSNAPVQHLLGKEFDFFPESFDEIFVYFIF